MKEIKNPPSPNTLVLIKRINQRKYNSSTHNFFAFLPFEKRERGRERERERGTKQRGWVDVMFRASPVPDGRASVSPVCSLSSERRSGNARRKVSTTTKTTCQFLTDETKRKTKGPPKRPGRKENERGESVQTTKAMRDRTDECTSSSEDLRTTNRRRKTNSRSPDPRNHNTVARAFDATMDENTNDNDTKNETEIVKPRFGMAIDPEVLPRNDETDKLIMKLFVPAVLNFLIIPLVGIVVVFWVGRMGDAVALAAQGAANQVFQSAFWIISFIPSVVAPMVAKAAAGGDKTKLQNKIGEGIFCAFMVGFFGMVMMGCLRSPALSLVGLDPVSPTGMQAAPYIGIRSLTFIPAIVSTVGFAAFRGTLDVTTPMKITLASQLINVILDPIFIFGCGVVKALGVSGAALATSMSELIAAGLYVVTLLKRKLVTVGSMLKPPDAKSIGTLLLGGAGVQLRSLAQNITFLAVTRTILTMDSTGTAAAAHTVSSQVFQLGAIAILALSTIATILIPQRMHSKELGGPVVAKAVADRLLAWGVLVGALLFFLQSAAIFALPLFTPIKDVQMFAVLPTLIGAALQPLNGIVFVAEGLMQGHQAFLRLAGGMFVSTGVMLTALKFEGSTLPGVWMCFAAFNTCRLLFALRHHFVDGPLGWKHLNANQMKWEETNKSA